MELRKENVAITCTTYFGSKVHTIPPSLDLVGLFVVSQINRLFWDHQFQIPVPFSSHQFVTIQGKQIINDK